MAIKKIRISNFKSFRDLEIELGKFNVLIGANASGKSNFIEIFKFLKDITNLGLDNAISMQGGVEYLRNINIGSSENFSLEVVLDLKYWQRRLIRRAIRRKRKFIRIRVYETIYRFSIEFKRRRPGFEIAEDELIQKFDIFGNGGKEKLGQGEIAISNFRGKINADVILKLSEDLPIKEDDIFPSFLKEVKLESRTLLLETPLFDLFLSPPIFSDISIYDFDPKLSKRATPITGKAEMEEDGSNLAIVLKNIIEDKDKKRKLFNLVKDLLPFIDDLGVEKFVDKSLLFKVREIYAKKQYLPAPLISDGTINTTALIIALYFEKKKRWLTIIEEPERNIHPYLISKIVEMMKDASQKKQVIVTTHNPEFLKNAELENILLVSRDEEGYSKISRPADKEAVKVFLKNDIGIEELYIQNLLEV